jgi:hypothetical protein
MNIHEQIAAFFKGVSKWMSTEIEWQNIKGPTVDNTAAAAA